VITSASTDNSGASEDDGIVRLTKLIGAGSNKIKRMIKEGLVEHH
jgi:hypothetical protein